MKRIRRETCAAVSVAEPVLGCDERVVHFTGERWVLLHAAAACAARLAAIAQLVSMGLAGCTPAPSPMSAARLNCQVPAQPSAASAPCCCTVLLPSATRPDLLP